MAVRAIAPVAGRPPNSGDSTFASPCAVSSTFGSCLSPDIRSATTAESSDSIAPSIATVSAGDSSVRTSSGLNAGIRSAGRPPGTRPNREPIVSTWRPLAATIAEPASSAMMLPGMRRETRRQPRMTAMVPSASTVAAPDAVPAEDASRRSAAEKVSRQRRRLQAEQVADLRARDQDRDAVGEADHDRPRNVLHGGRRDR